MDVVGRDEVRLVTSLSMGDVSPFSPFIYCLKQSLRLRPGRIYGCHPDVVRLKVLVSETRQWVSKSDRR